MEPDRAAPPPPLPTAEAGAPEPVKPKRSRSATKQVAEEAEVGQSQPAEDGLPVNEDGSPRFKPTIARVNTIVKRTVRTGQYESFEISTMLEVEADPRFSARDNLAKVQAVVVESVNEMADQISEKFKTN